jgi:DNA-binding Lrp family transcriptional regulator
VALDRIDFEIIAALQKNSRLANKELAARIGLAPSSCLERVRALTRAGVLVGFHAEVALSAMGIGVEALVAVRLARHSRDVFRTLYAYMLSLPEVLTVFHVSGINDLQIHVAVRDVNHLRDLVVEKFATRSEIEHCETSVIYDLHRSHQLPCYEEREPPARSKPKRRNRRAAPGAGRTPRRRRGS